ncbi:MAG: hypothetical protein JXR66_01385 [Bacteroidales bacterium]|nr:hypothetical protein [Bacteroidales bacterium]
MEASVVLLIIILLSFLVFALPASTRYSFTLLLLAAGIILTSFWALEAFTSDEKVCSIESYLFTRLTGITLIVDRLSAFFILVVNLTVLVGFLYAKDYLKSYTRDIKPLRFSIHYFSYLWLYLSMILVVMIRNGTGFLIAWEIMALSSFLLVTFEAGDRLTMKTGISYLIQMHTGMFFILISFLIVEKATGEMSFDALKGYFSTHSNILLFLLFFTGFGIKAGFVPLHTWLPQAHPAAPSHVSGVMSGVMIKMGIYGIVRVLVSVQHDLMVIGVLLLAVSIISGLFGVMMAIMQHDLKSLLAYHSIENIGIIGTGLGIGMIGLAEGNVLMSLLGFSGGLLHVLNHSLFKSLLFFNAGSVYSATHTRNIEQMGGLMKRMPYTAILFLTGSLAICGLPPFNGFISEYLIYMGMFRSLPEAGLNQAVILLLSISGLVLIGGLAVFCFTKAFGIVFLGEPRSEKASAAQEVSKSMLIPQAITTFFILMIGLASLLFVKPVSVFVSDIFALNMSDLLSLPSLTALTQISIIAGIFVILSALILLTRHFHLKTKKVEEGPTWGCGYTAGSYKQQYTASSYSYNYNHLAKPLLRTKKIMEDIREEEIFPGERSFESHSEDAFKKVLIDRPVNWLSAILKKIAVMQTGEIRHYILYAFVFILLIFLLTFFKII